jgi:hypothetical protein
VRPEGRKKVSVERILYDENFVRVRVNQQDAGLRVHVTFNPRIPYGGFAQSVTLETNDSLTPKKETVITGYVLEQIVCQPDHVSLGVFRSHDRMRQTVHLTSPYGKPFVIRRVVSKLPGLRFQADSEHKATVHTLSITGMDGLPHGSIEDMVTVETSLPETTLRLPLHGLCLSADLSEIRDNEG